MRLTLEQRTAALLALVEEYRAKRCAELLEPAREQARALLRAARAEGRQRVHTTIAEARQRMANELGAAQARLATERRLAGQRDAVQLLQEAWSALREALRARWRDAGSRQQWLDAHLVRALGALPESRWQIEFPADWPDEEREAFAERTDAAGVAGASWHAREDIDGGVRIRAGNNIVDATIDGLLGDRAALEGRLLDLLQEGGDEDPLAGAGESLALSGSGAR
ncbi:MAG: hypothetical protein JSW31_14990 [Burkholderiales bacterium]|nr:MAG: hypothetical protein JSW31_14990 [Burkholderiales bacterium]